MKIVNVALLGAGRIGKIHAKNIVNNIPNANLAAIYDSAIDRQWVKSLGMVPVVENQQAIFDDVHIDAVLICLPTELHKTTIMQAAKAHKHVFCEKPLALDVSSIDHIASLISKANIKLQVGFNRRFDPHFAKLKSRVDRGDIGQIHFVRISSRDHSPPPYSADKCGGIFLDMTIHDFDMLRFLTGSEIAEIYVQGANLINPKMDPRVDVDTATINVKFVNGALGVIDNSRQAVYGYDQRIEVFGSRGSLKADNLSETSVNLSNAQGVFYDKPLDFFLERYEVSFCQELRAFVAAITDDQKHESGA